MYLVTQGKYRENQLGYNAKTHEYVYFHKGKEIWREKGDESLLKYFNEVRAEIHLFEEDDLKRLTTYPIWQKYSDCCHDFNLKDLKLR